MIRIILPALAAAATVAACADTAQKHTATSSSDAASTTAAPPAGGPGDTSAASPNTVNPVAKGAAIPQTPPTLPAPPQDDKSMPPGPVNPPR